MANFSFNLKRAQSKGLTPINLIVRWNKRKLTYSTLEKVEPRYFENDKTKKLHHRIRSNYYGHPEFNQRLNMIESIAQSTFRKFINDHHRIPEQHELKEKLDLKLRNVTPEKKESFFEFIESFIKECESSRIHRDTGKKLAKITIGSYKNVLLKLRDFQTTYPRKIDFDTIDMDFYSHWIDYLTLQSNYCNNTVGRYTKTLKVFLNEATERELNTNLTFKRKRFKVISESVYKVYLTVEELNELYSLDLSYCKKLDHVRDLFIIGCWTGLRFKDLVGLGPENIICDRLHVKTQKTGELVVLPLHKMVKELMIKYKDYPKSLPPGMSNVNLNKYLKDVCKLSPKLQKNIRTSVTKGGEFITENKHKWECITVHTARRSFTTNLYLDGVNSLTIMKMTGHKSEKVFLSYLKASEEETATILEKHWQKKELETA